MEGSDWPSPPCGSSGLLGGYFRLQVIQQRFHLIGGLVLSTCRDLGILELVDRPPAANLAGILPSVERYHALMSGAA